MVKPYSQGVAVLICVWAAQVGFSLHRYMPWICRLLPPLGNSWEGKKKSKSVCDVCVCVQETQGTVYFINIILF